MSTATIQSQNQPDNNEIQSNYEFTADENKVFSKLSRQIIFNSFLWMLGGILFYILAFVNISQAQVTPGISFLLDGILQFAIGLSIIRSYDNFNNITKTEGSDIKELLQGLRDLDVSFRLTAFLVVCVIIIEYSLGMI